MKLEELIRRIKEQINARIAARNAQTEALNSLRAQEGFDATQEAQILTARGGIDAELDQLRAQLERYEAELREDEAVIRLQSQVHPVAPAAAAGESRTATVRIGAEERTYRQDHDPRGTTFLTDVALASRGGWAAQERLNRHMREEQTLRGDGIMERAAGTGAFAGFVIPQYLVDMNVGQATARRPFADLCTKHSLPATGMSAYLSKITTGTSAALQASEGDAVSETDIDDTLITVSIQTAAGAQTISRQAIERGIGVEDVTVADLLKRYHARIDTTLINQSTNGLTNVATSVAYTDASPTAAELYPKILAGVSGAEGVFLNDVEGYVAVMHPRRWRWLSAAMTSTWPFVSGSRVPAQSGASTEGVGYDKGVRGFLPDGTPVVTDANIATNLGAGTNEDEVYIVAPEELHLWEDPSAPMFIRAEQRAVKNLQIDLVLYGYFAYYLNRYTGGHAKIAGTGLVTPTFA